MKEIKENEEVEMTAEEMIEHLTEYWQVIADELKSYVDKAKKEKTNYYDSKWIWDRIEDYEKDLSELKHKIYNLYDDKEAV